MSNRSNIQFGEEQNLYDTTDGHQFGEEYEDDMAEETVTVRHIGTAANQSGEDDLPPLVGAGPPPPPPGRPGNH